MIPACQMLVGQQHGSPSLPDANQMFGIETVTKRSRTRGLVGCAAVFLAQEHGLACIHDIPEADAGLIIDVA